MNLQEAVEKGQNRKMEEHAERFKQWYYEILAKGYESAKSYTNIIIVVAYGIFFALWSGLPEEARGYIFYLSGLFMGISAMAFVLWEVYQMLETSYSNRNIFKRVGQITYENFDRKSKEIGDEMNKHMARVGAIWIFQVILTLVPGLIALGMFLWVYGNFLL
jgi:hypothetical protein